MRQKDADAVYVLTRYQPELNATYQQLRDLMIETVNEMSRNNIIICNLREKSDADEV